MAGSLLRKFIKKLFIFLTVLICVIFLLACLVPYLNPAKWWLIGFCGLSVPYLVILLIFSLIFWLIVKPLWAFLPLITLLMGWKQLNVVFATHPKANFSAEKNDSSIRIVDWNVGSMYGLSNNKDKRKHNRTEIADAIIKLEPDIICLQEFNHSYTQGQLADNIGLFKKAYPFYYFSRDLQKANGFYAYGSIIFSKYPMLDSGKIKYPGKILESLIYVDVLRKKDTLRIYTCHLQSFKFNDEDYADIEKIKEQDEETLAASKNIFKKMKLAFTRRGIQAEVVRKEIDESPYPTVICGDFNDVPNSFTYFHIRGKRQDVFLEKNFGIGRTYIALAPTLRIDYILPDDNFVTHQFDMVDEDLSDHLMLVTDVSLKK
jgi:endonuclease/exonuclease/phosphatase family metal-dependent hydrolase